MWRLSKNYTNWEALEREFSWVNDMAAVPQDPEFHAEGNVAIHTKMVLDALQGLEEFQVLQAQKQEVLLAAALLHDVEKRSTTVSIDGKIRSPYHAKRGAKTARRILYQDIPTPFAIREQIVQLVRYHGFPLWFLEKEDYKKEVIKLSLQVDTKLLHLLAKADLLGRISQGQEAFLDTIALFQSYCMELDCYGKAKAFPSPDAKMHYLRAINGHESYVPFEKTGSKVTLLVALPGTGKDYYIQKHCKDALVISLDDLRRAKKVRHGDKKGNGQIIQEAKALAKKYLAAKKDFVWNATNINKEMRERLIALFLDYRAMVRLIYLEVPYKRLLHQNKNRAHPIPESALNKMVLGFEVPTLEEAQVLELRIQEN